MRRPHPCVVLVARTHWTVSIIIVGSIALLHWLTRNLPQIEFGPRTYLISGGLAGLYFLAGTLVWFGTTLGPLLSRVCALLYLPRPQFGQVIWDTMNSPEFRAHFRRR